MFITTGSKFLMLAGWLAVGVAVCLFNVSEVQAQYSDHCFDTPNCNGFCYNPSAICQRDMLSLDCVCRRGIIA